MKMICIIVIVVIMIGMSSIVGKSGVNVISSYNDRIVNVINEIDSN